jgi:hypothetical protein
MAGAGTGTGASRGSLMHTAVALSEMISISPTAQHKQQVKSGQLAQIDVYLQSLTSWQANTPVLGNLPVARTLSTT